MMLQHDIAIIGAGPVGIAAALSLEKAGRDVALIAPSERHFDSGRTAALMTPSLDFLDPLLPEGALEAIGAELAGIRIIDVTGGIFRAPTTTFRASEIDQDRFGLNLPNDALVELLESAAGRSEGVTRITASLTGMEQDHSSVTLELDNGDTIEARIVIGADGKHSRVRELSGIACRSWSYKQSALTFHISHERDHLDISTEFHTREGPFTLVPLADGKCSVVWMMRPDKAEALIGEPPQAFAKLAQETCHSLLGKLSLIGERALIPMSGLSASMLAKGRVALIGEAAHAFPPIGAQGLNLGIRDVRDLAKALDGASDAEAALRRYAAMRRTDVLLRTAAVDGLNRSLLAAFAPLDALRGFGMTMLASFSPLRKAVMRAGIGDAGGFLPRFGYGNKSAGR
jgi:2-octaprenyl-6-methoxyphenol hydroxylase